MFRAIFPVIRNLKIIKRNLIQPVCDINFYKPAITCTSKFSTISNNGMESKKLILGPVSVNLMKNPHILNAGHNVTQTRTVTKFSMRKGKRKTVHAVTRRFFRLHWGGWIRNRCGKHKKIWKKSLNTQRRLRQHVFCNSTQSWLLDKMVTKFWKKPKYYVDDPYEPYHTREEWVNTRKKPLPRR